MKQLRLTVRRRHPACRRRIGPIAAVRKIPMSPPWPSPQLADQARQGRRRHAALALVGFIAAMLTGPAAASEPGVLIRDVTVFDGRFIGHHRSVLVRSGRIVAIGNGHMRASGASVLDGRGKTLLPGLIDAHVHLPHVNPQDALRQSVRLGVTTVIDMFTDEPTLKVLKQLEVTDSPQLADLRTAGVGATAPGGHPTEQGGVFPTIADAADGERFVSDRVREGSDFIKIILEDARQFGPSTKPLPTLDAGTLRSLIRSAHRHGKLAIVHVQTEAYARLAINAGADGLAHLFVGPAASPDFGHFAATHHVFVIGTLAAEYLACGRSNSLAVADDARLMPQKFPQFTRLLRQPPRTRSVSCNATDEALRQLESAGVRVLIGTDSPVPGSTYGASTLDELALFVKDGVPPIKALMSATSIPARVFHLRDRGEIKVGKRADLLLVQGDPSINIDDIKNIVAVWKKGHAIQRSKSAT